MSERDPNEGPERSADYGADPRPDPPAAPVAEIEAEIKAEIAAEMEAERARGAPGAPYPANSVAAGFDEPGFGDPEPTDGWPDPPPSIGDPAAEVLAWLRGEFDDVNANLQSLSNHLGRQEEAVLRIAGSQETELNSTLAELEGCSAQLRNEAATLRETRSQLAQSLPKLVADAVESAVGGTVAKAVAEMQATVAQLGAALVEALPAAVADVLTPPAPEAPEHDAPLAQETADHSGEMAGPEDLVSQLHQAQDEAAEWFSIVVDEAVRRSVERWLVPAVPAPAIPADVGPDTTPALDAPPRLATSGAGATVPTASVPAPEMATAPPPSGAMVADTTTPRAHVPESSHPVAPEASPTAGVGHDASEEAASPPPSTEGAATVTEESGLTCVLPGVAVGPTLAMGVSTALGRARLRRRRRRPAGAPAAGLFRHDPYAGELSRQLERFALARRELAWSPDPGATGPGTGGASQAGGRRAPGLVVVGERDGRELVVNLAAAALALAGPGAEDAGRAVVATLLCARPPSGRRVVATEDLLPPGPAFPGLDRFADLSEALADVEAEVTRRASTPTGAQQDGDGNPLVVLVVPPPPPGLADRLGQLAERGPELGLSIVVVGTTTAGAGVVNVDSGGRVSDPEVTAVTDGHELAGARMFRLGRSAMSEVLAVLAAASTDDDPTPMVEVRGEPFPVLTGPLPAPIQVRVLGPYRIDVGGEEVRSGLRAKARELLAFYLLHPEGTTLDVATEALWPEADPGRGSEWFWTALGNLRSRLRSVTGTKALKIIEREGDRYRIEPVFDVDLWRFQAALPPPGASTGDPEWAAALQTAADMYDGELLAGVDWAWADVPREDLRRRAVDVLVSLGATRLVAGDIRGALDVLSHAVEVDPVAEQLYRRIMRLHARQSRPDEVEATFERLKARLGELGLEPTAESEQLLTELAG